MIGGTDNLIMLERIVQRYPCGDSLNLRQSPCMDRRRCFCKVCQVSACCCISRTPQPVTIYQLWAPPGRTWLHVRGKSVTPASLPHFSPPSNFVLPTRKQPCTDWTELLTEVSTRKLLTNCCSWWRSYYRGRHHPAAACSLPDKNKTTY